jgi:hypothetical protein
VLSLVPAFGVEVDGAIVVAFSVRERREFLQGGRCAPPVADPPQLGQGLLVQVCGTDVVAAEARKSARVSLTWTTDTQSEISAMLSRLC